MTGIVLAEVTQLPEGNVEIDLTFPDPDKVDPLEWEYIADQLFRAFGTDHESKYQHISMSSTDDGYKAKYVVR
jgi:hypothetical protein